MTDPAGQPTIAELETSLSAREVEIVRAAYRVIAERGGHRVSLQDVANKAGISKGLVLYHFGSKSNLLLTTMRWALLTVAERITAATADVDDPVKALDAVLDILFVDAPRNHAYQLLYLDLVEHAARDDAFVEVARMTEAIVDGRFADVIRAGAEAGVFDVTDPDEAAAVMRAVVEGTFLAWLPRPDWGDTHAALQPRVRRTLHHLFGVT